MSERMWKHRDEAVSPIVGGLAAIAVAIVLGVAASNEFMKFSKEPPAAQITGLSGSVKATIESNLSTSSLLLTQFAGQPILLREGTLMLTIDGVFEEVPLTAFAERTRDGVFWRAGDTVCVSGTRSDCLRPAGGTVTAMIVANNQLLWQGTYHLQAFSILSTGGIVPACNGPTKVLVVGKDITYGANGPQIPVYSYFTSNNGTTVQAMWNGAPVVAGLSSTYEGLGPSNVLGLRAGARGFGLNLTYSSWITDPHVRVLKNMDPVPQIPAFGNQTSIDTYLRPYVDVPTQQMRLAVNEAILLFEFNTNLNSPAADFQDYVALVQFPGGGCVGP